MRRIETICEQCDGTGLYHGFGEEEGVYVECKNCRGTGCKIVCYSVFKKRKIEKRAKYIQIHDYPDGNIEHVKIINYHDWLKLKKGE